MNKQPQDYNIHLDVRVIESRTIMIKDLKSYLEALPDAAANVREIPIEIPTLQPSQNDN